MTLLMVEETDQAERMQHARDDIATCAPEFSARTFLSRGQRWTLVVAAAVVLVAVGFSPTWTFTVFVAMCIATYFVTVTQRIVLTHRSLSRPTVLRVADDEARAVPAPDLPVYTVLVPMYNEAAVVEQLLDNLRAIEYPRHLLEVLLLVEADDTDTFAAVTEHAGNNFIVLTVPAGEPRTKPRALNYGLTF